MLFRSYVNNYILDYLEGYKDPLKNTVEYSDNMIRCLRLTKFIYIRGNGYYIDLEPRRKVEIESLLKYDEGSSINFDKENWIKYMGGIETYTLPWDNYDELLEIQGGLVSNIIEIQNELKLSDELNIVNSKDSRVIKENIAFLRNFRTTLQTKLTKLEFHKIENIEKTIHELIEIRRLQKRPSIELERLANLSMNILNDSINIKPNYPVGDDNEPTFTAPSRVLCHQ